MHTDKCSGQYCGICDCGGTYREASRNREKMMREMSARRWRKWDAEQKR